jgi:hypothetical protein
MLLIAIIKMLALGRHLFNNSLAYYDSKEGIMPTITIRLTNLPSCCRHCLEKCPECVLRAELWRQAQWQLSRAVPQDLPRYLVEHHMEQHALMR